MPPFPIIRLKPIFLHDRFEKISFFRYLRRNKRSIMMRQLPKIIKMPSHKDRPVISVINLSSISQLIRKHNYIMYFTSELDNCKINSTTSWMPRFLGNISFRNNACFLQIRIELFFCFEVLRLFTPSNKMIDCFLRAISIIYHQSITKFFELSLNIRQCIPCILCYYYLALKISINNLTNEILLDCISRLLDYTRVDVG